MRYLYIFRHGQTDWNKKGHIQGHSDICLNDNGITQANELRPLVSSLGIQKIYSSDLKRAVQTSEIINETMEVDIEISSFFREGNLGDAEGKSLTWVKESFGELFWDTARHAQDDFWDFAYPNGESRGEVITRFTQGVSNIDVECAAVSTHGGVLRLYLLSLMQQYHLPIQEVAIPNCATYKVCFDDSVEILQIN